MPKLRIAATLACLAALAGSASASGSSTATTPRHGRSIELFAPLAQLKLLDLTDAGFSLGDESAFSDDLLTRRHGRKVGLDGGVCTVVRVTDAATQTGTVKCDVTYSLRHGQITTQGLVPVAHAALSGTHVTAITGGTRRYRGASGQATVTFLGASAARIELSIAT